MTLTQKLTASAFAVAIATTAPAQLIITGIIDGPRTGGLPKAIEVYVASDVADLSTWDVQNYNNGGTTASNTFALSGSATAGDYLYIASESPGFTAYFGFAPDYTTGALNVNGNDVVVLRNNATIIDLFGVIGENPVVDADWNYQDTWWYRNDNTSPTGSFVPANWFSAPGMSDALDSIGTSGVNPASSDPLYMPVGSYVPEPGTYASIFGLVAPGFVLVRRRTASEV